MSVSFVIQPAHVVLLVEFYLVIFEAGPVVLLMSYLFLVVYIPVLFLKPFLKYSIYGLSNFFYSEILLCTNLSVCFD